MPDERKTDTKDVESQYNNEKGGLYRQPAVFEFAVFTPVSGLMDGG
jgi:hypothetical protein